MYNYLFSNEVPRPQRDRHPEGLQPHRHHRGPWPATSTRYQANARPTSSSTPSAWPQPARQRTTPTSSRRTGRPATSPPRPQGTNTPLFVTQGFIENNTKPEDDGAVPRQPRRASSAAGSGRGSTCAATRSTRARALLARAAPASSTRSCASTTATSRAIRRRSRTRRSRSRTAPARGARSTPGRSPTPRGPSRSVPAGTSTPARSRQPYAAATPPAPASARPRPGGWLSCRSRRRPWSAGTATSTSRSAARWAPPPSAPTPSCPWPGCSPRRTRPGRDRSARRPGSPGRRGSRWTTRGEGQVHVTMWDVDPEAQTATLINENVAELGARGRAFDLKGMDWTLAQGHRMAIGVGTITGGSWRPLPSGRVVTVRDATVRLSTQSTADDVATQGAESPWLARYLEDNTIGSGDAAGGDVPGAHALRQPPAWVVGRMTRWSASDDPRLRPRPLACRGCTGSSPPASPRSTRTTSPRSSGRAARRPSSTR